MGDSTRGHNGPVYMVRWMNSSGEVLWGNIVHIKREHAVKEAMGDNLRPPGFLWSIVELTVKAEDA